MAIGDIKILGDKSYIDEKDLEGKVFYVNSTDILDEIPEGYLIVTKDTNDSFMIQDKSKLQAGDTYEILKSAGSEAFKQVGSSGTIKPDIDNSKLVMNEGAQTEIIINDYNSVLRYTIETGSALTVTRDGNKLIVKSGTISEEDSPLDTFFRINSAAVGVMPSDWVNFEVQIINVPMTSDQILSNVDFIANGIFIGDTYIENKVEQEMGYCASGSIDLDAMPSDGNYLDLNGTKFTFRDEPDADNDVAIGANATECVANLLNEALPEGFNYTVDGTVMTITAKDIGTAGNDFTIDCDYVSGLIDTLSGGSDTPDTDWVKEGATTLSYMPREIGIFDTTTKDTLETPTEIVKDDNLILVDKDNNINEIVVDEVTVSGSTGIHDIFNDGSAIATYQLNGDATDLGGNYDGNWNGTEAYTTGKFGKCIDIGSNDDNYVNVSVPTNGLTELSISFLCKLNTTDARQTYYLGNSNDKSVFEFNNTDNKFWDNGMKSDDSDSRVWSGEKFDPKPNFNNWVHIVQIYKSGENKVFANNELVCTSSETYTEIGADIDKIGKASVDGATYSGDGLIDQVRIFNRALTSDEVDTLYSEERTKYTAAINQSEVPTKAFFNDTLKVSIALEETINRTFCKDVVLSKSSSTTTEFISINAISGLLKTGDKVLLDDTEVVTTDVNEDTGSVDTHDTFGDGSCVATYQLNGDATDLGGNYDGTAGDNITYDSGKFGDAAVFNGDIIAIETITLSNFSVSAWVCFSDDESCWLINNGDGNNALQACRIDSDGSSRIDVNTDGDDGDIATRDLSDGAFHHVVFIKDGSNGSVYVDNSKYSYDDNSLSTKDMSMKQFCRGDFKGQIDQVRIFNKALTSDEVDTLYNEYILKYTLTYDELSQAPETCVIPDRSTTLNTVSKTFDGDKFTKTFGDLEKQGRCIQRKVTKEATTTLLPPFTTDLYKGEE